ncbi:ferrochelatase [Dermatophilus congolensis]|uniref:ferrochelatase n=1 Tax=Dermatophilus congolensis TaxID=1863 RepID=UPI001AAF5794
MSHVNAGMIDGIVLVSFGGPRGEADVVPFLENVTAGRGVPRERLMVVGEHYFARGGVSPINAETQAQAEAMRSALERAGRGDVPVFVGNRNWDPYVHEALLAASQAGVRRAAVVVTSAYSGYSSCRQYREDIAAAVARLEAAGERVPELVYVRPWGLEPVVVAAWQRRAVEFVGRAVQGDVSLDEVRVLFVAHSIPEGAAVHSGPQGNPRTYERELMAVAHSCAQAVEESLGAQPGWDLVFCSRSGRPEQPWLVPDINDAITALQGSGVRSVVLVPIGFVADHMEVVQDLDTEAADTAAGIGVEFLRAPTLRDEQAVAQRLAELALNAGQEPGLCQVDCCLAPLRPGTQRPVAAFEG